MLHEPRSAGVFTPGFAPGTLQGVALSRSPSYETLIRLDTLEMGKVEDNPTPKRLALTPQTVENSVVTVPSPVSPSPTLPESMPLTLPNALRDPVAQASDGSQGGAGANPPAAPAAMPAQTVPATIPPASEPAPSQTQVPQDTADTQTREPKHDQAETQAEQRPTSDGAPQQAPQCEQLNMPPSIPDLAPVKTNPVDQGSSVAGTGNQQAEEDDLPDMYEDGSYWKILSCMGQIASGSGSTGFRRSLPRTARTQLLPRKS